MLKVENRFFSTLKDYQKWLKEEWHKDGNSLYSLEAYLAMGEFVWNEELKKNNFYMPTKQEILDLEIGSLAPDYTGEFRPITKIYAKEQDIYGKWFICYYVAHGEGGSVSNSLKEDELDITLPLSRDYKSHELNIIEAQMLQERGIELPKRLEWCANRI
jgi:hypothetical protein